MLLEQARRLQELAQLKRILQENLQQAKGFQGRQHLVEVELQQLQPIIEGYMLLRSHGVIFIEIAERAETAAKILAQVQEQFQADPTWILSTSFNPKPMQSNLQSMRNHLNRELQQSWKKHVEAKMVMIDGETLRLFEAIPAFAPTTSKVRQATLQLTKILYPKTEQELQSAEQLIHECNRSWETLHSDDVPTNVLDFLRSVAASGGAPLDAFTQEVASWLQAHGIKKLFRIQISV